VCPDIDTIIYGLCDRLDKKKGWGLEGDTFNFLKHLKEIDEESWFGIGDKDLTTHIIRTKMLKEGKKLSEITDFFVNKYNIPVRIIPASDDHYETHIITKDNKEIHLQEFWIKYKGSVPIVDVIHKNIEKAQTTESIKKILDNSKLIVFAPGNPITSIGSIIKIKSFDKIIRALKKKVVIISPFEYNKAISGPSEIYMKAKNIEPTTNGLVNFYSEFTNDMVFSKKDRKEIKEKIEKKIPRHQLSFYGHTYEHTIKRRKFCKIHNLQISQSLKSVFESCQRQQ